MSTTPIADHALLSDCHSAALVDRAGSVDWLCFPRFDSPAVLGRLLDDRAGHWSVTPTSPARVRRRYLDRSLVLETVFDQPAGSLSLVDALDLGDDSGGHRLGRGATHTLVRELHCTSGSVEVSIHFSPRPEFGLVSPLVSRVRGGVTAWGGSDRLVLSSPVDLATDVSEARGLVHLRAGQVLRLGLQWVSSAQQVPRTRSQHELAQMLARTTREWRRWAALHQGYTGPWSALVQHSGRVLQGLSYQPTGAIVAAATTSLPEQPGGERNWDYRYSWVRDASYTMEALWVAACPHEAADFFSFMATAAAGSVQRGERLQILFGVGGEHDLSERTLPHLSGWRDSRPVRVGNGAWHQSQVDVYGELLNAADRLAVQLRDSDAATRSFLVACADAAARRWREPDQGIWEIRGAPRHFVHSKLMCWVALDRAARLGHLLRVPAHRCRAWKAEASRIAEAVVHEGWSDRRRAFAQSFGSDDLDASVLMMPLIGFLPAHDPRVRSTVRAVRGHLSDEHGLVFRYDTAAGVDGLSGEEGTFLLCTFWLAHALALGGEVEQARETFESACGFVNDVGLLSEEVDPATGEMLGNLPQAFSHIGLVNAAEAIRQAEETLSRPDGTSAAPVARSAGTA